jgi:ABC-type multidrug transport system permease subunit
MSGGRGAALVQLITARVKQFLREPEAVFWTYAFPLLMLTALGLAFRGEPKETHLVDVIGPKAEVFVEKLKSDKRFVVANSTDNDWKKRLQSGKTNLVVDTSAESPDYWFEPRRAESVLARQAVENVFLRDQLGSQAPAVSEMRLEEKGSRYIDFLLPGLIGMNLMGGGMWGIGFVLVDMRMRKLLKRMMATPMRKGDFLLSVMLSRLIFTVFDMTFLLLFGWLAFGVTCQGNYLELAIAMLLGGASFAGLGLLIASRANTIDAISGLMNLIMLPMWIGSGVFFSADRFPAFFQPFIQALPLTCLVNILRGIMLEGESLITLWKPALMLLAWGVGSFAVALKIFRWER